MKLPCRLERAPLLIQAQKLRAVTLQYVMPAVADNRLAAKDIGITAAHLLHKLPAKRLFSLRIRKKANRHCVLVKLC